MIEHVEPGSLHWCPNYNATASGGHKYACHPHASNTRKSSCIKVQANHMQIAGRSCNRLLYLQLWATLGSNRNRTMNPFCLTSHPGQYACAHPAGERRILLCLLPRMDSVRPGMVLGDMRGVEL